MTNLPERCFWRRRKTKKKKTCHDITLAKVRSKQELVWWMKCNPQLVLQIVVTLLSGYSRMNAEAKQKKHQKQLDEIINNQKVIQNLTNSHIVYTEKENGVRRKAEQLTHQALSALSALLEKM